MHGKRIKEGIYCINIHSHYIDKELAKGTLLPLLLFLATCRTTEYVGFQSFGLSRDK